MIEGAVEELSLLVGLRPACHALGAAPATIYRRRRPPERKTGRPRGAPPRTLSSGERSVVLAELHSERFVDASPAAVWATLLDEGRYLCSERTMYRLLAGCGEAGSGSSARARSTTTIPARMTTTYSARRSDQFTGRLLCS
jgi:hypothetical protein